MESQTTAQFSVATAKAELSRIYKYRVEMHAHTSPVSACSQIPPAQVIEDYAKCGYDAVVITNHYNPESISRSKEDWLDYYLHDYSVACREGERQGVKVILGAEVRFTENFNDYLVYGVDRDSLGEIYDYIDGCEENFYRSFKRPENVILQAHPYRNGMTPMSDTYLDGIEVFNMHTGHNSRIGFAAQRYMSDPQKIVIAGSDYHHPGGHGLAALRFRELPRDSFELAAMLSSHDYIGELSGTLILM